MPQAIPNALCDGIGRGRSSAQAGQSARSKKERGGIHASHVIHK